MPYIKMKVHQDFVAAGVNRVVNSLDWGEDGRVVYGAHNLAVVYDTQVRMSDRSGRVHGLAELAWDHGLPVHERLQVE